jgi:predicted GNAT family acetyltransferase
MNSMEPSEEYAVRHNEAAGRYEIEVGGMLAVAEYEMREGRQIFTRTHVPAELRGRGLAEALVRMALAEANSAGRKVVPACSYVAKFIERNPQYRPLVAE